MTPVPVNILLVDDEPANLLVLEAILGALDANLVRASSGEEALRHILNTEFAAILLDVQMPTMSGFEVARMIRSRPRSKSIPIIFITAFNEPGFPVEDAYALGAVDYLTKPVIPAALRAKVAIFADLYRKNRVIAQLENNRHSVALGEKEDRIRLILDNTSDYAFIVTDVAGNITEWEGGAATITGWPVAEAIGQPIGMIFTPEDRAAGRPEIEMSRAKEIGRSEDRRWHAHKGGGCFFADGVMIALKDTEGHFRGFAKIFRDATAQQRAEDSLHDSNEQMSRILESAGEGIFGVDQDSCCTFLNAAAARMLGYSREELIGRPVHDVICHHRADGSIYPIRDCPIWQAIRDGVPMRAGDETFWHKNGTSFPVSYSVFPILDAGRHTGAVVTFVDITERKQIDRERDQLLNQLKTVNARMVDMFRQAPAFMSTMVGPDHVIEFANDRYIELLGGRDVIGKPAREALPEVDGQGFFEELDRVYRTGVSFIGQDQRLVLQPQSGGPAVERYVDFVYLALRNPEGEVTGILLHGIDLTVRKRAEQALRASEERYRTLFESMDEGFCIIDLIFDDAGRPVDYRFLETNPVFEKQTGLQNVLGKTLRELVPDLDDFWVDTYGRVAVTGESIRFIDEAKAMNRWFDVYATRAGGKDSRKVALFFTDITVKKHAEEDLRRLAAELSEANRQKSEFLATLAHELRNPLAPIRTGLEIMRLSPDSPAAIAQVREMMDRQVGNMVHLVDDLLDIARITTGKVELKKEQIELKEVVASAVETSLPLIDANRHTLDVQLPEQSLRFDVDQVRVAQILSNLLTNAAKYTPPGGQITLSARREGDDVCISVADSGIGIPADALPSVFDMFTQVGRNMDRAQGGLGIGLSLVRRLLELHGGTVIATSPGAGQGSTFTVRLPLAGQDRIGAAGAVEPGTVANQRANQSISQATNRPLRILVADDNRDAAESLSALLQIDGHTTWVAHDGKQALKTARKMRPDVVFLDIGMPGMNGYEVAHALRLTPGMEQVALVALTGWGAEGDRERSRVAGFDHHLTKPVELANIDGILREMVVTSDADSESA